MDNQSKTFNNICRVCLNYGKAEEMVSLVVKADEKLLSPYGLSYEKLTKQSVILSDYLPTKICCNCKKSLQAAAGFILQSEASDRKLAKLVNFSTKQDLNGDMVKEVVNQYTQFNQNFPEDSNQSSCSSRQDEAIQIFAEKVYTKYEMKHPKVKVELDSQQVSEDSDTNQAVPDNVDVFLYSIHTLLTTKIDDIQLVTKPKNPKPEQYVCPVCQRVLANPNTYKNHVERHGKCRYVCDHCGKGFPVMNELSLHQVYLHGIGSSLKCDHCPYNAGRKLDLIEHIRLHTGERPFTCEICGLTFRRKAIYRNHLKFHGEKSVQCDYCPRKFYRLSEMRAHSNNVHDRLYVYVCKVCNVSYAMAKTVRRHMLVKHGIPRDKQGKVVRINKDDLPDPTNIFRDSNLSEEITDV